MYKNQVLNYGTETDQNTGTSEQSDSDHFKKIVKLVHNDIRTHVNIMMLPEKFDYCFQIANGIPLLVRHLANFVCSKN